MTRGRLLRWVVSAQRWHLLVGMTAGVGWTGALAAVPAVLGVALDGGVASGEWAVLGGWLGILVGVGAAGALAAVVRHWFAVRLYADTRRLLVVRICERALSMNGGVDARLSAGELVSHVDSDSERIGAAVDVACRGTGAVVTFVAVAAALLAISPPLGAVVVGGLPPLLLAMMPLWRPLERRARAEQETLATAAGMAADTITGLRVLKPPAPPAVPGRPLRVGPTVASPQPGDVDGSLNCSDSSDGAQHASLRVAAYRMATSFFSSSAWNCSRSSPSAAAVKAFLYLTCRRDCGLGLGEAAPAPSQGQHLEAAARGPQRPKALQRRRLASQSRTENCEPAPAPDSLSSSRADKGTQPFWITLKSALHRPTFLPPRPAPLTWFIR